MYLRGADSTQVGMVFNERVMDYTVTTLRNDVVDYRRVLRLTTVWGPRLFLAFPNLHTADHYSSPIPPTPTSSCPRPTSTRPTGCFGTKARCSSPR